MGVFLEKVVLLKYLDGKFLGNECELRSSDEFSWENSNGPCLCNLEGFFGQKMKM